MVNAPATTVSSNRRTTTSQGKADKVIRTLCLALCITAYLRADVYEVERVISHNHGSVTTVYRYGKAGNVRLKETGNFRNLHTIIWNQERQAAYELDDEAHEYWEPPKADSIAVFAAWIARRHVRNSGKRVDITIRRSTPENAATCSGIQQSIFEFRNDM